MQLAGPGPPLAQALFGLPVAAMPGPAPGQGLVCCSQLLVSLLLMLWHCRLLQKKPAAPSLALKFVTVGLLAGFCKPAERNDCMEKVAGKVYTPVCLPPPGFGTLVLRGVPGVKVLTAPA